MILRDDVAGVTNYIARANLRQCLALRYKLFDLGNPSSVIDINYFQSSKINALKVILRLAFIETKDAPHLIRLRDVMAS